MSKDEALEKMKELTGTGYDPESAHWEAEQVLCELLRGHGYDEVVSIFESMTKWYA